MLEPGKERTDTQHTVFYVHRKGLSFFLNTNLFKETGRLKTCHWVPIGAMGPTDIETALYPPHSSGGARVRSFIILHAKVHFSLIMNFFFLTGLYCTVLVFGVISRYSSNLLVWLRKYDCQGWWEGFKLAWLPKFIGSQSRQLLRLTNTRAWCFKIIYKLHVLLFYHEFFTCKEALKW